MDSINVHVRYGPETLKFEATSKAHLHMYLCRRQCDVERTALNFANDRSGMIFNVCTKSKISFTL